MQSGRSICPGRVRGSRFGARPGVVGVAVFVLSIATAAVCASGEAAAEAPRDRFTPIDDLVGACWEGVFPDGESRDRHCYTWAVQGKFIRDVHEVRKPGSDGVYSGETLYGWDDDASELRFWYFNSQGGVSEGGVAEEGGRWVFTEEYAGPGGAKKIRSRFVRDAAESYRVVTEEHVDGAWKELWATRFVRVAGAEGD